MNKQMFLLAASILVFSNLSIAVETQTSDASDKRAVSAEAAKPGAQDSASKAKKASVPETQKDKENKKKCRAMGGSWQLGHCNVG